MSLRDKLERLDVSKRERISTANSFVSNSCTSSCTIGP